MRNLSIIATFILAILTCCAEETSISTAHIENIKALLKKNNFDFDLITKHGLIDIQQQDPYFFLVEWARVTPLLKEYAKRNKLDLDTTVHYWRISKSLYRIHPHDSAVWHILNLEYSVNDHVVPERTFIENPSTAVVTPAKSHSRSILVPSVKPKFIKNDDIDLPQARHSLLIALQKENSQFSDFSFKEPPKIEHKSMVIFSEWQPYYRHPNGSRQWCWRIYVEISFKDEQWMLILRVDNGLHLAVSNEIQVVPDPFETGTGSILLNRKAESKDIFIKVDSPIESSHADQLRILMRGLRKVVNNTLLNEELTEDHKL